MWSLLVYSTLVFSTTLLVDDLFWKSVLILLFSGHCVYQNWETKDFLAPKSEMRNHEEYQYLNLVRDILEKGVDRGDRTGTGTRSLFGTSMRFSLRNNRFPLLTTKKVFFRGIVEELLFFISGSTNCNRLSEKGVKIWDADTSREILDQRGFRDRKVGDLGPGYSFQWRHAGAEYKGMDEDYTNQGIDQLKELIHKIKTNPEDRRLILCSWNVKDVPKMSLPPCHVLCQFYVANGEISCSLYQRSADYGLGISFNICSYSLLTRMIAQVCDLKPGEFVHFIGDSHIYSNHFDALKQQLEREPYDFPTLEIDPNVKDIEQFKYEHFHLKNYKCHEKLYMKMAV